MKYAEEGILVMMEDETNVLLWTVLLGNFPPESPLAQDVKRWHEMGKEDHVKLEVEVCVVYLYSQIINISSWIPHKKE